MVEPIVDYSASFPEALVAQGRGRNVLILYKNSMARRRADGKLASFELEHRWLSADCSHENDQAWACVQGSDITLWQQSECKKLLSDAKRGQANMFERWNLF